MSEKSQEQDQDQRPVASMQGGQKPNASVFTNNTDRAYESSDAIVSREELRDVEKSTPNKDDSGE